MKRGAWQSNTGIKRNEAKSWMGATKGNLMICMRAHHIHLVKVPIVAREPLQ